MLAGRSISSLCRRAVQVHTTLPPYAALGSIRSVTKVVKNGRDSKVNRAALLENADDVSSTVIAPNVQEFQLRRYKPRTPGLRHRVTVVNDHLWKGKPHRPLTFAKRGTGGRNNTGRITVRHRGGGVKRRIRMVDFTRSQPGPQDVQRIEYDPGRSAHIALIKHRATGTLSYILACDRLRAGDVVESFRAGIPKDFLGSHGGQIDLGMLAVRTIIRGNCLPISMIPVGTIVHNIGNTKYGPGKFVRSAGTYGRVLATGQEGYAIVKLQSGETRKVPVNACATIGVASNINHRHRKIGKAGRNRLRGIRPTVRGVAMNACDHPHGGGRGKSKGGKDPRSIWGVKKFVKTVRKVNKFVVQKRPPGIRR
ncbi:mitochondrial 54S ribosomal protein rml2 [Saitoella coloradoensis]